MTLVVNNPCETATFTLVESPRTHVSETSRVYVEAPTGVWAETTSPSTKVMPKKSSGQKTTVEARELGGQIIFQYEEPVDSASVAYGANIGVDHYALCGDRTHFLTLNGRIIQTSNLV